MRERGRGREGKGRERTYDTEIKALVRCDTWPQLNSHGTLVLLNNFKRLFRE